MPGNESPDLLTVAEAAGICRVSQKTVRRLIRAGQLPRISFGERGRVLIKRADLDAFLDARYGRVCVDQADPPRGLTRVDS